MSSVIACEISVNNSAFFKPVAQVSTDHSFSDELFHSDTDTEDVVTPENSFSTPTRKNPNMNYQNGNGYHGKGKEHIGDYPSGTITRMSSNDSFEYPSCENTVYSGYHHPSYCSSLATTPQHHIHGQAQVQPSHQQTSHHHQQQQPSKCRQLPCRTFISTGSCPYGDRCVFLHDARIVARPVFIKSKRKSKEDMCTDAFFWPTMPWAQVMGSVDNRNQPSITQPYVVPVPVGNSTNGNGNNEVAVYSMWEHFMDFLKADNLSIVSVPRVIPTLKPHSRTNPYTGKPRLDVFVELAQSEKRVQLQQQTEQLLYPQQAQPEYQQVSSQPQHLQLCHFQPSPFPPLPSCLASEPLLQQQQQLYQKQSFLSPEPAALGLHLYDEYQPHLQAQLQAQAQAQPHYEHYNHYDSQEAAHSYPLLCPLQLELDV